MSLQFCCELRFVKYSKIISNRLHLSILKWIQGRFDITKIKWNICHACIKHTLAQFFKFMYEIPRNVSILKCIFKERQIKKCSSVLLIWMHQKGQFAAKRFRTTVLNLLANSALHYCESWWLVASVQILAIVGIPFETPTNEILSPEYSKWIPTKPLPSSF